jgi:hypothetical protein
VEYVSAVADIEGEKAIMRERLLGEEAGVELEGCREVGGEVGGVVAPGVDVEFVGDVAGGEDFVERGGAGFEAIVVLGAAIEINF